MHQGSTVWITLSNTTFCISWLNDRYATQLHCIHLTSVDLCHPLLTPSGIEAISMQAYCGSR